MKSYRREIWKDALQTARKRYGTRADLLKTLFGLWLLVLIIIVGLALGMWNRNQSIPAYMWGLFGANVLTIVGTALWVPIVAYINMWSTAAKRDELQQKELRAVRSKLRAIENSRPILLAHDFGLEKKGFQDGVTRDAIYIDVYNQPKLRSEDSIARRVYPTVIWYDMKDHVVAKNSGRWWIINEDKKVMKVIDQQIVDLDSNGISNRLHFAIKDPLQRTFFAWSRAKDGADERLELTGSRYRVVIHLQASNHATADFEFVVENNEGSLFIRKAA